MIWQHLRLLAAEAAGYLWHSLRAMVSGKSNRRLAERGSFIRQYFLHVTGIRPIRAITCHRYTGNEGCGSQAIVVMNAMVFARETGITYLHTPFETVAHADRPMPQWAAALEKLFNLGDGEQECLGRSSSAVNYCYRWRELHRLFGINNQAVERFGLMIPEFRRKYYRGSAPRSNSKLTVAVNIRRGHDVTDLNASRFTSTDIVLQTTRDVASTLADLNIEYEITVYSNGTSEELRAFSDMGIKLRLNPSVDIFWTMSELVEADLLIAAKSCFSYYAGFLSDGIKIYAPTFHYERQAFLPSRAWPGSCSDWIPVREDGSFDRGLLRVMLNERGSPAEG